MEKGDCQKLIREALKAREFSYSPYSDYRVGAALMTKEGEIFTGCNIENASYGATNCEERTAIFSFYASGYRKDDIEAIAIVSNGKRIGTPCGICRQVLSELLNPETPIILATRDDVMYTNIKELLPYNFSSEDLK